MFTISMFQPGVRELDNGQYLDQLTQRLERYDPSIERLPCSTRRGRLRLQPLRWSLPVRSQWLHIPERSFHSDNERLFPSIDDTGRPSLYPRTTHYSRHLL